MIPDQRLALIEDYLRQNRFADLRTLADQTASSLSTVRRSLDELARRGVLRRHHGGASLIEPGTEDTAAEFDFARRERRRSQEKHSIAREIAARIRPGMTVILDAGTTAYAVARIIAGRRVQIITNSLPVAGLLAEVGGARARVTGGHVHNRLGALTGPDCEECLARVHAELAVLGAAGLNTAGVWNLEPEISAVQRRMIAAADAAVFAVDATKFGRPAPSLICPLSAAIALVTDAAPPSELGRALRAAGTKVTVAPESERESD
jgi:DeoR/GlpR family transcriptional regulator of sugar metabolism